MKRKKFAEAVGCRKEKQGPLKKHLKAPCAKKGVKFGRRENQERLGTVGNRYSLAP